MLVNPTNASVHVDFGAAYTGSGLTDATAATLPPHSALILAKAGGGAPFQSSRARTARRTPVKAKTAQATNRARAAKRAAATKARRTAARARTRARAAARTRATAPGGADGPGHGRGTDPGTGGGTDPGTGGGTDAGHGLRRFGHWRRHRHGGGTGPSHRRS